ncbi:hypothetical protein CHLNCDRAFT_13783, partial [Chlorella variabilis]
LRQLHAVDDPADERFASIVELVRCTFQVDCAMLSLIDSDSQCYVAQAGFQLTGNDRQSAFSAWALAADHPVVLVVENALEDARFRANPRVVGPPHVRFYACVPLVGTDAAIHGVLAIADCKPRRFATEQLAIL